MSLFLKSNPDSRAPVALRVSCLMSKIINYKQKARQVALSRL